MELFLLDCISGMLLMNFLHTGSTSFIIKSYYNSFNTIVETFVLISLSALDFRILHS